MSIFCFSAFGKLQAIRFKHFYRKMNILSKLSNVFCLTTYDRAILRCCGDHPRSTFSLFTAVQILASFHCNLIYTFCPASPLLYQVVALL